MKKFQGNFTWKFSEIRLIPKFYIRLYRSNRCEKSESFLLNRKSSFVSSYAVSSSLPWNTSSISISTMDSPYISHRLPSHFSNQSTFSERISVSPKMSLLLKNIVHTSKVILLLFYILINANSLLAARPIHDSSNSKATYRSMADSFPQDHSPVPPIGHSPCTNIPVGAPGHCNWR